MRTGWMRLLSLIGVAAFLANAQCYAQCVSVACHAHDAPASSCHREKPAHEEPAPCSHQYSQVSAPEAGVAKVSLETVAIATLPELTRDSIGAIGGLRFLSWADTGSPPGGRCCSTISVLRI
jgi:hypothetical protein